MVMETPNGGSAIWPTLFSLRGVVAVVGLLIIHRIAIMLYNISPFHPLYRFPGPKLAAASRLYDMWFDLIKQGKYNHEIQRLHELYGPIVRINPDELHCNDPKFIEEIYPASGRKRDKPKWQLDFADGPNRVSIFASADHDVHRMRRSAIQKFFSKAQITKLEPVVHDLAQRLCDRLLQRRDTNKPFDVTTGYSCYTTDVISGYCYGEPFGYLEQESFEPNLRRPNYAILNLIHPLRHFPSIKFALRAAPLLQSYVPGDMKALINIINVDLPRRIEKARAEQQSGIARKRQTIFEALFESDLPPEEKTTFRLTGEAWLMISAGTETTSWTLSVLTFHLLTKPALLERLTRDLKAVVKDPLHLPSWNTLEQIPLLYGVIQEGIRLSYGVTMRTGRIPTEEDIPYHGTWTPPASDIPVAVDYVVPRNMAISMGAFVMNHVESVFPDSHEFVPERWLDAQGQRRKDLDRYLMSFSKGSRQCLGINLAYCEMYLALVALILRVYPHMKLYQTTIDDIQYDYDLFVPMAKKGSRGIWVEME